MGISGREYSIGNLLSSATWRIEVPRHQRPYSWEAAELKDLWSDLMKFSDNLSDKTPEHKQYFLGSVVGQQKDAGRTLQILDGQQRLATLTIMLAVLRDVLYEADEKDTAYQVHMLHIAAQPKTLKAPPTEFVLKLGKLDDPFLRATVLAYPPEKQTKKTARTASQQSILKARNFVRMQIKRAAVDFGLTEQDVAIRLHTIVSNHLTVVLVSSEVWDDVTDIFERLNDRGKGLSTLDLLRVHLIGRVSASVQPDVETAWDTVYEISNSATKVDAFLRHSWITYRGDVKSRSLYKEIKSVIDRGVEAAPLNDPLEFSQSLASDAELYRELVAGEHPDPRCKYWLSAIATLGATSLLPAALAGRAAWSNYSDYAELLKRLVTTFMRWNVITSSESTVLEEAAFAAAKRVRARNSLEDSTGHLRAFLHSDAAVKQQFVTLKVFTAGYQRYLLEALEDRWANPKGDMPPEKPTAGSTQVWIEHIYPQTPEPHWPRWQDHDDYLNRVGNLTLIKKQLNAGAKNKAFEAKKDYYADSGLELNKHLLTLNSWSPQSIGRRQKQLSGIVAKTWPRF